MSGIDWGARSPHDHLMPGVSVDVLPRVSSPVPMREVAEEDPGEDEQPQRWLFTFGTRTSYQGIPLRDRYVRFHGTWIEARLRMIAIFGTAWCSQYGSEEAAGVAAYGLTELILPDPAQETK